MKKLWAPWRIDYIRSPKEDGCIFCKKSQSNNDRNNLILYRGNKSFVLMNLYPYSNGHLMISPYDHTADTNRLSKDCNLEIMELANASMNILKNTMNAEGFNFGANIGASAGAGIADHLHYHIVPRWGGDTNFMPVVGNTKVHVQGLQDTYNDLIPYFQKIHKGT